MFVGIGFVEYARKELLLNPRLVADQQNEAYFRVNSLFFDPNIYGRFLAMVMLGIATVVIWTRRTRDVVLGAVLLAILWAGLVLSFSQSSFAALLVGLAVLAALRWSVKWTAAVCAAAIVVGLGVVLLAPGTINLDLSSSKGADKATSGRVDLIKGGARLFRDRPLQGWGSGSYSVVFRREEHVSLDRATTASHTIPVTVAAEQGIVGLAVYLALLVAALARLFGRGVARSPLRCLRGRRVRGAAGAHDGLRRVPGGPDRLGAAGHGRRARRRPAAGAGAGPPLRRRRDPSQRSAHGLSTPRSAVVGLASQSDADRTIVGLARAAAPVSVRSHDPGR